MSAARSVYHLSPTRLWVLPAVWLAYVLAMVALGARAETLDERTGFLAVALVLAVVMAPFVAILWQSRLELTETGITHFQLGYSVRSDWSNITALSMTKGREGLYLREPGSRSVALRVLTRLAMALPIFGVDAIAGDAEALAEGRFIALMPFMHHWHQGALKNDIERWAPGLVENAGVQ